MNSDIINIKNGSLFQWHFRLVAVILMIGAVVIFLTNVILSLVLLLIGVLILTGCSGVLIDKSKKTYRAYNSFLFLKTGASISYEGIEKIFINANRKSQKIYTAHTLNSSTFKDIVYDGYLKFLDGTKIHLASKSDKNALMDELKEVVDFLEVEVHDNTNS